MLSCFGVTAVTDKEKAELIPLLKSSSDNYQRSQRGEEE